MRAGKGKGHRLPENLTRRLIEARDEDLPEPPVGPVGYEVAHPALVQGLHEFDLENKCSRPRSVR